MLTNRSFTSSLDIKCDAVKHNLCQVNIDGGPDINVAAVLEAELQNFIEDTSFMYRLVTLDKYEKILGEFNIEIDNETLADDQTIEFYENPENLQKIQLEHQNLTKIKSAAFVNATALVEIDLDNNQILLIGENAFSDLINLTTLSLAKNNLTTIRSYMFAGAVNLKHLYLNQNKIHTIEDGAFTLAALETILLQNNQLKSLSSSLFVSAPRLTDAIFEENELTHIGDAFTHLKKLRMLILDYNRIEDINLWKMAQLPALNHLSLRKTGIRFNDDDDIDAINVTSSSSKLEELHLAENYLSNGNRLMRQLAMFKHLTLLNLEYNELRYLNDVYMFRKMFPHLQMINLAFNSIQCDWVEQYVDYLRRKNIKVLPFVHTQYDECVPDDEDDDATIE